MMKKYPLVCYVGSIYALFLYLIHSKLEEIFNTLFLLPTGIPQDIAINLPNRVFLEEEFVVKRPFIFEKLHMTWLYNKYKKSEIFRSVSKKAKIYALDHGMYAPVLIGNRKYTLIEDSHGFFSNIENSNNLQGHFIKSKSIINLLYKKLYGRVYGSPFGQNDRCNEVLLSGEDNASLISHLPKVICNIQRKWNEAEDNKRSFVKRVYNLTNDDIANLNSLDCIIYTQNFSDYGFITKDEQIELYAKIVAKYPGLKVLIKPHPRDGIHYEDYISNIKVWRKCVPSQLLTLCGVKFKKYITVYSSSVNDLEEDADIDWYGTEINEKLYRAISHIPIKPRNAHFCTL